MALFNPSGSSKIFFTILSSRNAVWRIPVVIVVENIFNNILGTELKVIKVLRSLDLHIMVTYKVASTCFIK